MLDAVHAAWANDIAAGLRSVMIAGDNATARELNLRARAELIQTGHASADGIELGDGTAAGIGDLIVTRQNDRRITSSSGGWVRNGDTWTVHNVSADGSITAIDARGAKVHLAAGYVAEHLELGYATTTHRVQGRTTDTAHALITAASTREQLYVAATRGRVTNTGYLDTTRGAEGDPATMHGHDDIDPRQLFAEVIRPATTNRPLRRPPANMAPQSSWPRPSPAAGLARRMRSPGCPATHPTFDRSAGVQFSVRHGAGEVTGSADLRTFAGETHPVIS